MFAFDLGFGIDLDKAQACLSGEGARRGGIRPGQRAPRYVQYEPEPLRVTRPITSRSIAGFTCEGVIGIVFYDFGAVSLTWRFPIAGTLDQLRPLAKALYENEAMLDESRHIAMALLARIRPAVDRPGLVNLFEDYILWHAHTWEGNAPAEDLVLAHAASAAKLIRAEDADLSPAEIAEALSVRVSYTTHDTAVIDWNASLLLGPEQDDALAVLEFANVEMLEMRFLDGQLDNALARAHEAAQRRPRLSGLLSYRTAGDLRRIASFQVDSALLFEGVNNALKLVGDQYLARVYRFACQRLHLPEWDASILRKLGTLETIYDKVQDRQSARRMEVLEWIVILLIAFEVVMSFVR